MGKASLARQKQREKPGCRHQASHLVRGNIVRCDCGYEWSDVSAAEKLTARLLSKRHSS